MVHCIMMVGIPGSGKSEVCEKLREEQSFVVISASGVRQELSDNNEYVCNSKVFDIIAKTTATQLCEGNDVVIDATNTERRFRVKLLREIKQYMDILCKENEDYVTCDNVFFEAYVKHAHLSNCLKKSLVDDYIVAKKYVQLHDEPVLTNEGFDKVCDNYSSVNEKEED